MLMGQRGIEPLDLELDLNLSRTGWSHIGHLGFGAIGTHLEDN
jgi:hypothetical protein